MPKKSTDSDPAEPAADTPAAPVAPAREKAPATVKVKVICPALYEAGQHYLKGDVFETTPERAHGLGTLVTTNVNL